jgi:hypothetical protein
MAPAPAITIAIKSKLAATPFLAKKEIIETSQSK